MGRLDQAYPIGAKRGGADVFDDRDIVDVNLGQWQKAIRRLALSWSSIRRCLLCRT